VLFGSLVCWMEKSYVNSV